jgi:hypothetical protein
MGSVFDLMKPNYDYVDSPFWSVFQIKVKYLNIDASKAIGEEDLGKVLHTFTIIKPSLLGIVAFKSLNGGKAETSY